MHVLLNALVFERHDVLASYRRAKEVSQLQANQLVHSVLSGKVAQRHVNQHRCVLDRTGHEVQHLVFTANEFSQVGLLTQVTNLDDAFAANDQHSVAVLFAVVWDVVVAGRQTSAFFWGDCTAVNGQLHQAFVVAVVLITGFSKDIPYGLVTIDLLNHSAEFCL